MMDQLLAEIRVHATGVRWPQHNDWFEINRVSVLQARVADLLDFLMSVFGCNRLAGDAPKLQICHIN